MTHGRTSELGQVTPAYATMIPGEFSKRDSPGAESMKDAVSIRALQREDILVTTDLTARSIAEHG
jgi:hypothetical protein